MFNFCIGCGLEITPNEFDSKYGVCFNCSASISHTQYINWLETCFTEDN